MRRWIAAASAVALMVILAAPSVSYTEDTSTIRLARSIYALARDEDYATKLALGTVVMNRIEDSRFEATLSGVLSEQQQFPAGTRYDDESLKAAHAVLSGTRTLPETAVYFHAVDASTDWGTKDLIDTEGGYRFYSESGNI